LGDHGLRVHYSNLTQHIRSFRLTIFYPKKMRLQFLHPLEKFSGIGIC